MRIIVGISGASGVEMGHSLLRALKAHGETHLVMTQAAKTTWRQESAMPLEELALAADFQHDDEDLGAVISSGSFETDGMVVLPCSMKTLSAVANGYAAGLLVRAADVCLKEGRKVVLCPRETPLGKVHLKNMLQAADLGCLILPPMLTFYGNAKSVAEQVDHLVGKILMQFGLKHASFRPWQGARAQL
ncbi:MAG: UbiX family flavin prenyltransferase [Deltaproteobacteria bacterium]|nr:UbiX family flavin prenyltransferase [Deltaproteobacteria bacterium]